MAKKKKAKKTAPRRAENLRVDQAYRMRMKGYLTAKEVSETYGVGLSTVYQWLREKQVQGKTIGSARYISEKSLMKHLGPDHKLLNS